MKENRKETIYRFHVELLNIGIYIPEEFLMANANYKNWSVYYNCPDRKYGLGSIVDKTLKVRFGKNINKFLDNY